MITGAMIGTLVILTILLIASLYLDQPWTPNETVLTLIGGLIGGLIGAAF